MRKITLLLVTLALLLVGVGSANVYAAKTIGKEFTSVASLSGKTFAIVNKADKKSICNQRTIENDYELSYLPYSQAFSNASFGYLLKIENAEGGGYYLHSLNAEGNTYQLFGWSDAYLQSHSAEKANCCYYIFKDADGAGYAVWDIEFVEDKGFTLKNHGTGGYLNDPTKRADSETPGYFQFCEVGERVEISVGGETRNYQLYVPDNVPADCPLVLSLHGASGHSTDYSPFGKEVADAQNCIVAYPQGKDIYFPIFGTVPGWDATGQDNADVEFLKAVIEDVASKYQIDRKRIYCCGFSNGGMMTYAMANACSDEIAAFASISGFPLNEFHLRHTGSRPVPFLHIHGKSDTFVPHEKMPTIVDEMVARMGANPVPTTTPGNGYTKSVYAAGSGSFPYVYYEIEGMTHEASTAKTEDGNSALTMWKFFEQYTLDSPCDPTLKWAPRIEQTGFAPASHGFTMNSGTTLLQFGGDQYTTTNQNVYHSLQFDSGKYKLCFKSTGDEGDITVKIEKLTGSMRAVLNKTINVGQDAELPFKITDGWGEYKLTMTRPSASANITVTDIKISQMTGEVKIPIELTGTPEGVTVKAINPETLEELYDNPEHIYAAKFTASDQLQNMFQIKNMSTTDAISQGCDRIIVELGEAAGGTWNIHGYGGQQNYFSLSGLTSYTIMLNGDGPVDDFTIFNWFGGAGQSIIVKAAYFYKPAEDTTPMEIASAADWKTFTETVNGGKIDQNAILTADIEVTDGSMAGTGGNKYAGVFNGQGHTLKFTFDGAGDKVAPFSFTNGATIIDLKTSGSIISTGNCLGGIIGDAYGANLLIRCASDVAMTSNDTGNGRVGGLVGRCTESANSITFENCVYNGAISSAKEGYACGFVGWSTGCTLTVSNCLVAPISVTNGGNNFSNQGITVPSGKYALYATQFGSSTQGTAANQAQLYNGYVAYTLNSDITEGALFIGQANLNSSNVKLPSLTSTASMKVLKMNENNGYANPGGLLPDPASVGMLSWKFAMSGEAPYQTNVPATQSTDMTIYGSPDAYNLVVGSAGASTFVFPFNAALPDGVEAYELTFDGTEITATPVASITADKPVLINAEPGTYKFGSGLNWWDSVNFSTHTSTTNGALTGVYNTTMPFSYVPQNAYVLQNGKQGLGFYKVTTENKTKITSFRAYLTAQSNETRLAINFAKDEPTGITEVSAGKEDSYYNLGGQRVSKPTKGLYIVNGRVVVIK